MKKAGKLNWKVLEAAYKYRDLSRTRGSKQLLEKTCEAFLKILYDQSGRNGARRAIELLWADMKERIYKRFGDKQEQEVLDASFYKVLQDYLPSMAVHFYTEMKQSYLISKGKNQNKQTRKRNEIYKMFKNQLIVYVYYYKYRERLLSWPDRAKNCDILLVQAPLGLGKTFAISSALKENKKKSAIIFMPTTRMCKEIYDYFNDKDVYCIEGINGQNCDNFYAIMERYNLKHFSRKSICDRCDRQMKEGCRLVQQYAEARKKRIIITTHAQYGRFVRVSEDRRWEKNGKSQERDFFVIDENIVATRFLQPVEVPVAELNRDCNILSEGSFKGPILQYIMKLRDKVLALKESSLIAPIDKNFELDNDDRKQWSDLIKRASKENKYIKIRHLVDYYCWAISNGFTVRIRELRSFESMRHVLYLHNQERPYSDLEANSKGKTPKHVFFDATEFRADDIFKEYFPAKRIEKLLFDDVKSLGLLRIHHVNNEHLSRTSFLYNTRKKREKTQIYINNIIEKHGKQENYFVITTAAHEKHIVEYFEKQEIYLKSDTQRRRSNNGYLVICHYGNQKGINDARHCRVGILLGTYFKPAEVNIASSLPHIKHLLDRDYKISNEIVQYNSAGRMYKEQFHTPLGEIDEWIRSTEHEQGIGRTRHLYHDIVDFYIVSRDDVSSYPIFKDGEYGHDIEGLNIFRRAKRTSKTPGSKAGSLDHLIYGAIKKFASKEKSFTTKDIHRMFSKAISIKVIQNFVKNNPDKVKKINRNVYALNDEVVEKKNYEKVIHI
jgi:hypothetical protein